MAKPIGPLFFVGTMRGINYYFREGEPLTRRAGGGFSRKNIKESPNMETVRKSNTEFAHCSKVNKAFKLALQPYLSGYKDGTFHSRLMQLFLNIKDCNSVSERGNRKVSKGIATTTGQQLVKAFVFIPERPHLFGGHCEFEWNPPVFKVSDFNIREAQFPKEADCMEISVGLLRFDFETLAYEHVSADPLAIARDFQKDAFTIPCPDVPGGEGMLFSAVRASFYQTVNGERHLVPDTAHTGVRIISVLVDRGEG
ncbi:hypothetical protein KSK37_10505 [Kaistella sp. DKR-2]|uniref:hypothetical protein n=1 Tax=Kaistella soli TaxID=2849654 RepID=UPI001C278DA6|nr:hypothetical protein [Kaistella soli]MBU8883514.1 hypothetical protein [Kaistella soli]